MGDHDPDEFESDESMGYKRCVNCGLLIYLSATQCPRCGAQQTGERYPDSGFWWGG